MGEVIKTFLLGDAVSFERLVLEGKNFPVEEMIQRCVQIKAAVVLADEREEDGRRLLNLGHTIGHALEQVSGYSVDHGQAVAYGIFVIYRIAASLRVCSAELANKVEALLRKFGFPLHYEFSVEALTLAMVQDKKRQGESITVVLPEAVGSCRLHTLPLEKFRDLVTEALYKAGEPL
ncbi:3-dehydroquinate synthase [bioreactor metagenome]|uniref:3-dehydroquinate synthase n=1 Tax=bioreactor metagenome TaxID=1076179 RepID=A0A645DUY8_9ZZZZ